MSARVMAVRRVGDEVEVLDAGVDDLPELIADPHVYLWVDLDTQDDEAAQILGEVFELHPLL